MKNYNNLVIHFDEIKDEQYPNGAWFVTYFSEDDPFGCDKWYGKTPDEALEAYNKDNQGE